MNTRVQSAYYYRKHVVMITAHLLVPVVSSKHQGSPPQRPNLVNGRPRHEQFPGDLLVMV